MTSAQTILDYELELANLKAVWEDCDDADECDDLEEEMAKVQDLMDRAKKTPDFKYWIDYDKLRMFHVDHPNGITRPLISLTTLKEVYNFTDADVETIIRGEAVQAPGSMIVLAVIPELIDL